MQIFSKSKKDFAISVSKDFQRKIMQSLQYKNYISKVYAKGPTLIMVETENPSVDVVKDLVYEDITKNLGLSDKFFTISE